MARDLRVAVLEVSAASTVYSREAEDCKLADLAAKWAVTRVRRFALDKESIQIAVRLQRMRGVCAPVLDGGLRLPPPPQRRPRRCGAPAAEDAVAAVAAVACS